eukprot:8842665-Heterocapsa_arctica.AAC.1
MGRGSLLGSELWVSVGPPRSGKYGYQDRDGGLAQEGSPTDRLHAGTTCDFAAVLETSALGPHSGLMSEPLAR